jgi:glutamyl-tRNA synthetase
MSDITVRFPPSPTGQIHVGNVRTILYNYLFAKKHNGRIVFRSEDTDRARSSLELEEENMRELSWLGLSWDEFHRQTERTEIYTTHLRELIENGDAYLSPEESKLHPGTMVEVVRLKNPNRTITFNDEVRGEISFDTTELGDIVIARAIDDPVYHFTVVVDDALMGISHVIRGEDHISNTPRQILIQEALGFTRPVYAHLPILLGEDRTKLSKRHGSVSLRSFHDYGYTPEAIINYLALLGWNAGDDREFFTINELIDAFDLSGVQKGGAIFSREKLGWYNAHYLRSRSLEAQTEYLLECPGVSGHPIIAAIKKSPAFATDVIERIHACGDLTALLEAHEFDYLGTDPVYDAASLLWKKDPEPTATCTRLAQLYKILENVPSEEWSAAEVKHVIMPYAEVEGKGSVLWPMRYALSGQDRSPDPFVLAEGLGKEITLRRLQHAHTQCSTLL